MIVHLRKPTDPYAQLSRETLGFFQIQELGANNISVLPVSQIEAKLTAYAKYLTIDFKVALVNVPMALFWVRKWENEQLNFIESSKNARSNSLQSNQLCLFMIWFLGNHKLSGFQSVGMTNSSKWLHLIQEKSSQYSIKDLEWEREGNNIQEE